MPADAEHWRRASEILGEALDAPKEEREALIAAHCAGDEALAADVLKLLRADARAPASMEPFLREGLLNAIDEAPTHETRIGPYRLVREIGRGGMGIVYLAERKDEFRMRVAIKILRAGLSNSLHLRFRRERQILASLDHPNIAKLLDGGATVDGNPYLVMEYVDGEPITTFCESRGLGTEARLRLFHAACTAVQYAHQHLIIHRDLKPQNILVTSADSLKLLDFGIAKLIEGDEGATGHTLTGFHPMTPAYASPEQASGQPITTATDVYSLGVILFELVCGARPYAIASTTPLEVQRAIMDTAPSPPSRIRPGLSRDIDSIVAMAMRKEPSRRYVSAAALADDIQRHLDRFPIRARPDGFSYHAARFISRNRRLVLAGSLGALALIASSTIALWQAHQAGVERALSEKRFTDARRIANSMVFELHDAIAKVPGNTQTRALLLRRASEWLDALARDAPGDMALAEELAAAYERLGAALGGGGGVANLGETDPALVAYRKALALRERLASQAPEDAERQDRLTANRIDLAYALSSGPEALAQAREAVRIAQALRSASPGDARRDRRLAQARFAEGSVLVVDGRRAEAQAPFQEAAKIFESLLAREPRSQGASRNVGLANKRLGAILLGQGRATEALQHYGRALAVDEAQVSLDPGAFQARYDLSVSHIEMGGAKMAARDVKGALADYESAASLREQLLTEDPANALARRGLASALMRIGTSLGELAQNERALVSLRRAETLLTAGNADPTGEETANVRTRMAEISGNMKRSADAVRLSRLALETHQKLLQAGPRNAGLADKVAWDLVILARALLDDPAAPAAEREAACEHYRRASGLVLEYKLTDPDSSGGLRNAMDKGLGACNARKAPPEGRSQPPPDRLPTDHLK